MMLVCVACRHSRAHLLDEHARSKDQILGLLQTYFHSAGSQRRGSAFQRMMTYKSFSFPVLCMYEDAVLQQAEFKDDQEPATLVFDLRVEDLADDWYAHCHNTPTFLLASPMNSIILSCRGGDWWRIKKKGKPDGDVVILEGIKLEYCFSKPYDIR